MKKKTPRIVATFLILNLVLPPPASALRPKGAESPRILQELKAGLEEGTDKFRQEVSKRTGRGHIWSYLSKLWREEGNPAIFLSLTDWHRDQAAWEKRLTQRQRKEVMAWLVSHRALSLSRINWFEFFQSASRRKGELPGTLIYAVRGMQRQTGTREQESQVLLEIQRLWNESAEWEASLRKNARDDLVKKAKSLRKAREAVDWVKQITASPSPSISKHADGLHQELFALLQARRPRTRSSRRRMD